MATTIEGQIRAGTLDDLRERGCNVITGGGIRTTADANGIYLIKNLLPGDYRVNARASGFARAYHPGTFAQELATLVGVTASADTSGINFTLEPGTTISGTVVRQSNGTPIAFAQVSARNIDGPGGITFITLPDGTYTIRNIPAGGYTVQARADDFAPESFSETPDDRLASRVTVAVGTPAMGINFTLDTATGTISGRVVRQSDGAPVRNANVNAFSSDLGSGNGARTNADGSYTIHNLSPGSYLVEVDASGFADEYYPGTLSADLAIRVPAATETDTGGIDFTLEPGGTISGKVTEAAGGTPVIDAGIVAQSFTAPWPPASPPLTFTSTRMDGTYTLSGVPLVGQRVVAVPIGHPLVLEFYNSTDDPAAALPVTPNATGIDFSLDGGGTISGTVFQTDGSTPIPRIIVLAEDTTTGVVLGLGPTERDGTYRTTGLPAGDYRVFAKDSLGRRFAQEYYNNVPDAASATAVTVVVPGDTPNIDFTLATAIPPPTGLIGWWPGDGNANDVSDGNDGTLTNGATFAPGMVQQAFIFDGVDDHVLIPDSPNLNPTSAITLSTWVFVTGKQGSNRDILTKDGEVGDRQYFLTASNLNKFRAHIGVPGITEVLDGQTSIDLNRWYFVAMTYDGSSLKLYVDGLPDGSKAVSGAIITTSQPVRIGGGAPAGRSQLHLPGRVDEASIYNRALTGAEIQSIFDAGSAGMIKP